MFKNLTMRVRDTLDYRDVLEYGVIIFFYAWIIYNFFYGERIFVGNGLGWDGSAYANLIRNLPAFLTNHGINIYRMQRVFVLIVPYCISKLFGYSLIPDINVIKTFYFYNALVLTVGVITLWKLSKLFNWSRQVRLICFAGIFLNYPTLKLALYYPVLTDTTALIAGLLVCYFYFARKPVCLLATSIIAAFVFPKVILLTGLILFVFPLRELAAVKQSHRSYGYMLAMIIGLIVCLYNLKRYFVFNVHVVGATPIDSVNIFLSAGLLPVYFFVVLSPLLDISYLKAVLKERIHIVRVLVALSVFACVILVIKLVANSHAGPQTIVSYLQTMSIESIMYPAIFIVSHYIYYGPIILVAFFMWPQICQLVKSKGLGMTGVFIMMMLMSISSEVRCLINFLPLFAIVVSAVLSKKKPSWTFTCAFVFLSLLASRFWLPINHGTLHGAPFEFPFQWYFMSQGPYMSKLSYYINIAQFTVGIAAIYLFLRKCKLLPKYDESRI